MTERILKSTFGNKALKCFSYRILFRLCCLLITAFILLESMPATANAATGIKIYDYSTKKTTTYTDKQIKVTLNGNVIGASDTPGILVDGIALLPVDDIFQDSAIAADCTIDKAGKTITLSKYKTTIVMTVGSKTATVNGSKVTMSAAPRKIKYSAVGITKLLVPSRFVSETLGLEYSWNSAASTVAIRKQTLLLAYNGGEAFEYSGTKGKVTVDNKKVTLGTMPSIIVNNTAMLRASKVFAGTTINAQYQYNKADQSVTLSKNGNTLVMTIGSKIAYLNNKKVNLSTAPIYVKNCETNSSYVMVPGGFTATSLGYDYQWNNSTATSAIKTKKSSNDAELGDSGDITETGTILGEWKAQQALYSTVNDNHTINADATDTNNYGTIFSVTQDTNSTRMNSETFVIAASAPFNRLQSVSSGNTITITSDNELCTSQTYQMYGVSSSLVNTITLKNHTDSIGTTIELGLLRGNYHYDISLSPDKLSLYVTVYYNAITDATIGTNSNGDYLIINSTGSTKPVVSDSNGCITIDLPDTINSIGNIATAISGSKYISQLLTFNTTNSTQMVMTLTDGYQYYCKESGNRFTISFQPKNTSVTDNGDYEVVIPKPSEVTDSMLSDTDHYFSNYFVIHIQGDYTSSITADKIKATSSVVDDVTVSLNDSGNTDIKISTTKLQGYRITSDKDNIYVHIGDPSDIYKNIVILDPGHGGTATGAIKSGNNEKDINLQILYTIGKKYFNKDTSKLKVYYTRTSDTDVSLDDRAAFADKIGADLFISLHMNAAPNAPSACGTEVFYSSENNAANAAGLTSKGLATAILNNLYPAIGTSKRGVKEGALVVTKKNSVPAILIELGFLTNSNDYSIIMDEEMQELAMESVYNSLLQLFESYPTGR